MKARVLLLQLLCFIAFAIGTIAPAWSAGEYFSGGGDFGGNNEGSNYKKRKYHKYGITTQFFGDPFPSLNSLNINWNMSKLTRFHLGAGVARSTSTTSKVYGAGIEFTFNKWVISPIIGVNYSIVQNNPNGLEVTSALPGASFKQEVGGTGGSRYAHFYWSAGMELRVFKKSLVLGAGYKASQKKDIGGWGYASIGLFFK